MGKIAANPYGYKPEDEEEELDDQNPAFEKEEGEEELTIQPEGEVVATDGDEEEETPETPEAPKPITFKTQEELDEYTKTHAPKPAAETPAPTTPTTPATPDEEEDDLKNLILFKGYKDPETGKWVGEAPDDWNDFARKIIKQLSPKTYAPKILDEIKKMTTAEKQEVESIDKAFDEEFDKLATEGKVPKRGTKEGDEINVQISTIGAQYGQGSMTKAYELWSKIPKEQGGGLDYKPTTPKVNPSKQASRLIGSSAASQAAKKPASKMSYAKLHSARSVDELIDEE